MQSSPEILDFSAYLQRLLAVQRPGAEKILAFYEHRVGAICTDVRLLLAPLDDHLCHRGDGVFESIAYKDGRLFQLSAHMERMQNSAAGLKITPPCSWEMVQERIMAVAAASGKKEGAIRILLGRGPGGFGISPAECPEASLYIIAIASKTPSEAWYAKGLTACRSAIPAKQSYLAKLKNANYLPNVLMAEEALANNVDVAFSFDANNYLAEAAVANVALVAADGALICPHLTHALSGTTLMGALEVAKPLMPIRFENITEEAIWAAQEVLLFGSTPLCVGVTHYEGRPIGKAVPAAPGPVSHALRHGLMHSLWTEGTAFE